MTDTPAPGWYPDPQTPGGGLQRWWDGSSWTEHTQAAQPQPHQQHPNPTPHQPTPNPYATPTTTTDSQARTWAMAAHLSALLGAWVALAFVGPLVVYLVKKDDHPYVRRQAAEALNFNLSMLLYSVIFAVVFLVLILIVVGVVLIPFAIAGAIAWLVLVIVGGVKANQGVDWKYPLTIRFVN